MIIIILIIFIVAILYYSRPSAPKDNIVVLQTDDPKMIGSSVLTLQNQANPGRYELINVAVENDVHVVEYLHTDNKYKTTYQLLVKPIYNRDSVIIDSSTIKASNIIKRACIGKTEPPSADVFLGILSSLSVFKDVKFELLDMKPVDNNNGTLRYKIVVAADMLEDEYEYLFDVTWDVNDCAWVASLVNSSVDRATCSDDQAFVFLNYYGV